MNIDEVNTSPNIVFKLSLDEANASPILQILNISFIINTLLYKEL